MAAELDRHPVDEGLGYGLDREFDGGVTGVVNMAVDGRQGDAEARRIGLGQFGDLVGDMAVADPAEPVDAVVKKGLKRQADK